MQPVQASEQAKAKRISPTAPCARAMHRRLIWGTQLREGPLTRVLDAAWWREGRKGDAQRAFMKARYLAPSGAREAVDSLIARQ